MSPTSAAAMTTPVTAYSMGERQRGAIQHEQLVPSIPIQDDWQIPAMRAALGLIQLPGTWERGGRVRPNQAAVERALEMIRLAGHTGLVDLKAPYVVPLAGGGVQVEWEQGERRVEIELWNDGSTSYLQLQSGDPILDGEGDLWPLNQVKSLLGWLQAARE